MELNKKILKIGLSIIVISVLFITSVAVICKVKRPVFLKIFMEKGMNFHVDSPPVDGLELKYITNIWDDRKIDNFEFKDNLNIKTWVLNNQMGYEECGFSNYNKQSEEKHGIYKINTVYIQFQFYAIDKKCDEIELNNAKVTFDDGSTVNVNLGRLILYNYKESDKDIRCVGSSGSSDGVSSTDVWLEKNIKLLNVESPLLNDFKDYLTFSVGDTDYKNISGTKYEKHTGVMIYSKVEIPKSILKKYSFYDIQPKLYYEDEEGKRSYIRIYNINYAPPTFDFRGIFNYLESRGKI